MRHTTDGWGSVHTWRNISNTHDNICAAVFEPTSQNSPYKHLLNYFSLICSKENFTTLLTIWCVQHVATNSHGLVSNLSNQPMRPSSFFSLKAMLFQHSIHASHNSHADCALPKVTDQGGGIRDWNPTSITTQAVHFVSCLVLEEGMPFHNTPLQKRHFLKNLCLCVIKGVHFLRLYWWQPSITPISFSSHSTSGQLIRNPRCFSFGTSRKFNQHTLPPGNTHSGPLP